MDIQKLISGIENCACGRSHYCPVDHIAIGSGALEQLPAFCESYNHILLVSDKNTRGIRDPKVSRKHAAICCVDNKVWVRDLQSTNGTYINETRLNPAKAYPLNPEDVLRLGDTRIRCVELTEEEGAE